MPWILSGVCSLFSANYFPNPFGIFAIFLIAIEITNVMSCQRNFISNYLLTEDGIELLRFAALCKTKSTLKAKQCQNFQMPLSDKDLKVLLTCVLKSEISAIWGTPLAGEAINLKSIAQKAFCHWHRKTMPAKT